MKEQLKHIEAFEYFFNLIEKGYSLSQSIEMTAEHKKVTSRTMWKWYKEFDWDNKITKKKDDIAELMDKQSTREYADNRIKYLQILHKVLDRFIKDGFPVEIKSMKDLEIIIRNCLVLQDKPTEVIKTTNTNHNVEINELFDDELMKEILEQEKQVEDDD